jgi:hypothetical protein
VLEDEVVVAVEDFHDPIMECLVDRADVEE